jgi:hypothetical protein
MGPNRRLWIVIAATVVAVALVVLPRSCGDDTADAPEPAPAETPDGTAATDTTAPAAPTTTLATDTAGQPDTALSDPVATGRELTQRFLDILSQANPVPLLEEFLSPAFQLQRSNGTFVNRDEYLEAPASVSRYSISDENFRSYQDGPVLTVRFTVEITETIDTSEVRVTSAERLGVFVRSAAGWQLVAWSNFNPLPAES